jgi:hypothetical protein
MDAIELQIIPGISEFEWMLIGISWICILLAIAIMYITEKQAMKKLSKEAR